MVDSYIFSINKTYIVFILNAFYLTLITYIISYIINLDEKYSIIIASNKKLEANNEVLLNIIRSLEEKLDNTRTIQEVFVAPAPLPMSDNYKIFLIKLIFFLIISILAFLSIWYVYAYIKLSFWSHFIKGASSVGSINTYFSSFLKLNNITEFNCRDSLNNVFFVKVNDVNKTCEIFITPCNSENTYSLEDFFKLYPEFFRATSIDGTLESVVRGTEHVVSQAAGGTVEGVVHSTEHLVSQVAISTPQSIAEIINSISSMM